MHRKHSILFIICILLYVATLVVGVLLTAATPIAWELAFDDQVHAWFGSGLADGLALTINTLFGTAVGPALLLAVAVAYGIARRDIRPGLFACVVMACGYGAAAVAKVLVARPRPLPVDITHPFLGGAGRTDSFPSGHTAIACAIMLFLCLWAFQQRRSWLRALTVLVAIAVVVITGWSRLYLGVHFPTDVLAAVVISSSAVTASYVLLVKYLGVPSASTEHAL